jgi:3-deoxy-7-phosphoheptulonate synthase/chorismate mutase
VSGAEDRFAALREEIAANDRAVVEGVNARLRLVAELWRLKDAEGTDRLDPERERRLREELQAANGGPLSPAGLDELVAALLELTKRELGGAATPAPDRPRSPRTRPA